MEDFVLKSKDELFLGVIVVEVSEAWTSKTCDECGRIHRNLGSNKVLKCPSCDTSPETREEVGRALLHSDGKNRFWDKSMQLVFFENGKGGYLGEHSMMDGTTTTRMVNYVLDRLFKEPESSSPVAPKQPSGPYALNSTSALQEPKACEFYLSSAASLAIKDAETTFNEIISTKELKVFFL